MSSDNIKRIAWPLAVITELVSGKDGHVRVAKIRTKNRLFVRPIQRLYPLEVTDSVELTDDLENRDELIAVGEATEQIRDSKVVTRSGREVRKPVRYLSDVR